MAVKEIVVETILNKITRKDDLFLGNYTVDPYSNCQFGCLYCDSSFDKNIYVKNNAAEVIDKELKENQKGRVIVGSVHDPYQNVEKKYMLTRKILEKISKHDFSCHILTKSNLILRDAEIIKKIKNPIVTISILSYDKKLASVFEKKVHDPASRLSVVELLNDEGIKTGVAIIPFLPFLTEKGLKETVKEAKRHKAQYILYKYLELKGDQKKYFFNILEKYYPEYVEKYKSEYKDSYMPSVEFIKNYNNQIKRLALKHDIKTKIN